MAPRCLLRVDAYGLTAMAGQGHGVAVEGEFAPDAAGRQAFAAYLAKHPHTLFHLLADSTDEAYHVDDIPHLSGRDRTAVIARKLGQHFYGTPLTAALPQGRLAGGRRDERILCAALTRPQALEPWLEALRQAQAALVGIFTLPQAIALLAATVAPAHPQLLLTTLTRGGWRQTYFEHGQLRFSRPTSAATDVGAAAADACTAAAAQIQQYLSGQRQVGGDATVAATLDVLIVAHPAQAEQLRRHCPERDGLHFEMLDLVAAARRLGLATAPPDSFCDTLLAHLLLRRTPRVQFAPAAALRSYQLRRIRHALRGGGLATLGACLLLAAQQQLAAGALEQDTQRLRQEIDRAETSYQALRQALPPAPMALNPLRALVDRYEALLKVSPGPEPLYRHLGQSMPHFPQIELDRLDWRLVNRIADADSTPGSAAAAEPGRRSGGPFAVVDIYAHLPPTLATDRRAQYDVIDAFAVRLRHNNDIEVRTLSLPFDTASNKVLRSDDDRAGDAVPRFALRVAAELRP